MGSAAAVEVCKGVDVRVEAIELAGQIMGCAKLVARLK